jgi:hypothetical protein
MYKTQQARACSTTQSFNPNEKNNIDACGYARLLACHCTK